LVNSSGILSNTLIVDAALRKTVHVQWPDKVGKGLMFISLDVEALNALRAELEGRGVDVKDGHWGYRLMVIVDPDHNELYFPYPSDDKQT
jgi:hypothetical protein